jgi:hypothetical protein
MKRTLTVTFELTQYQLNQIRRLGNQCWPQNLGRDELCRRLLLDGCDALLIREHFSFDQEHPRLLEPACTPLGASAQPAAARG